MCAPEEIFWAVAAQGMDHPRQAVRHVGLIRAHPLALLGLVGCAEDIRHHEAGLHSNTTRNETRQPIQLIDVIDCCCWIAPLGGAVQPLDTKYSVWGISVRTRFSQMGRKHAHTHTHTRLTYQKTHPKRK